MFFPEKINIKKNYKVLEIGPGNTPFYKSNVLLEKKFTKEEFDKQTGLTGGDSFGKKIIYYSGDTFPFSDHEFDYVICSHVLEHIPMEKIHIFISEISRVASKGYIEIPLYSYELLYNLDVHMSYINVDENNKLYFFNKEANHESQKYKDLRKIFQGNGLLGRIVGNNEDLFISGFEWRGGIDFEILKTIEDLKRVKNIDFTSILLKENYIKSILKKTNATRFKQAIFNRFGIRMK